MNPRVERSLWGLQKANHMVRQITRDGAHLRTRLEVHIRLSTDHAQAGLTAYDCDLPYPGRLHMAAALGHMRMANYITGMLQQSLSSQEMKDGDTFLDEAINTGLKAVDETKKGTLKQDEDDGKRTNKRSPGA